MTIALDGRNIPQPTPETAPFWHACRAGELHLQRCTACTRFQFYPRRLCSHCGNQDLTWEAVSGRGKIRSFTVVRRALTPAYRAEAPYVLALIELDEGPTLMSNVIDCDVDSVRIGQAVHVCFERWTDEITVPKFSPA